MVYTERTYTDNEVSTFTPITLINKDNGKMFVFLKKTRSIEVSEPKLIGHYETDIYGKNLVMDGCGGIRVYNLPVQRIELSYPIQNQDSDNEEVVDDWEQLAEISSSSPSSNTSSPTEVFIPDTTDLNFNLLQGYILMNEGGNKVGFSGKIRDRTNCMRWMVKNHQKIKCDNGSRLFDVDFCAHNGALRSIMTSQFSSYEETAYIAVILFRGTYYVFEFEVTVEVESELNNKRSFCGLRFEDFVSRGMNGEENGPTSADQNNYNDSIKYYNVVQLNFDIFKLLVAGEVDCAIPGSSAANGMTPRADDFIEIKTSAPLEHRYIQERMSPMFRCGKISSWFAQCTLMGVKHVVVGIRDEDDDKMICKRTQAFTLEEIRRHSNGSWSKNRCYDDLKKFLHLVKETVVEDNPDIINVFVVKDGLISGPEKKTLADKYGDLPDISGVVELMKEL